MSDTTQTALDMPDRLRPPFYAHVWRYGVKDTWDDDNLYDLVETAVYSSDAGECYLQEIGDADGPLWTMNKSVAWVASDRAPARTPERMLRP